MSKSSSIKRLIVCCDGTWQGHDKVRAAAPKSSWPWPFSSRVDPGVQRNVTSNVAKMGAAISTSEKLPDGNEVQQIVYYQAGLGTGMFATIASGYTGSGLDENVAEAYYFLANNYEAGDEIFLFGFSRGAYTARCVAGLVARFGVLHKGALRNFPEAYHAFRTHPAGPAWDAILAENHERWPRHEHVTIKVVGVWDTVGNLGVPVKVSKSWKEWVAAWFDSYEFHNPNLSTNVEHAYQALGLDETRSAFSPALWHLPEGSDTELVQCWFPGVHINTGGGSTYSLEPKNATTDSEQLADMAFAWMLDLCSPFLAFDPAIFRTLKDEHDATIAGAPKDVQRGWAVGRVKAMGGLVSRVMGWGARTPGRYDAANETTEQAPPGDTCEFMHPSVRVRRDALGAAWACPGLEAMDVRRGAAGSWEWARKLKGGGEVVLPEWQVGVKEDGFERALMGESVFAQVKAPA